MAVIAAKTPKSFQFVFVGPRKELRAKLRTTVKDPNAMPAKSEICDKRYIKLFCNTLS